MTRGSSTLRQTYTLTNTGGTASPRTSCGTWTEISASTRAPMTALRPPAPTATRSRSSTSSRPAHRVLLIDGSLAGDETPTAWTIQPFNYRPVIEVPRASPPRTRHVFNDNGISSPTARTTSRSASSGTRRSPRARASCSRPRRDARRREPRSHAAPTTTRPDRRSTSRQRRRSRRRPAHGRERDPAAARNGRDPAEREVRYTPASGTRAAIVHPYMRATTAAPRAQASRSPSGRTASPSPRPASAASAAHPAESTADRRAARTSRPAQP